MSLEPHKHIFVEEHLEKRFCSLFDNDKSIIFSPNFAKLRPYYKIGLFRDGTPSVQNTGYVGARDYTIITEKELDEMSLIPPVARVHYLLSL